MMKSEEPNNYPNKSTKGFEFNYKFLVAIAAVLAPVAYLIGYAYHQGKLSAYGISPDSFPISTYITYVNSYFAVGSLLLECSNFALKMMVSIFSDPVIFIALLVVVILLYAIFKKIIKSKIWIETKNRIHSFFFRLFAVWIKSDVFKATIISSFASYIIYTFLTIILAIAILWWALPLGAYSLGYHDSKSKIEEYEKSNCCNAENGSFSMCKVLIDSNDEIVISGLLVANSEKFIAFYNDQGSTVMEFPNEAKLKSIILEDVCEE